MPAPISSRIGVSAIHASDGKPKTPNKVLTDVGVLAIDIAKLNGIGGARRAIKGAFSAASRRGVDRVEMIRRTYGPAILVDDDALVVTEFIADDSPDYEKYGPPLGAKVPTVRVTLVNPPT